MIRLLHYNISEYTELSLGQTYEIKQESLGGGIQKGWIIHRSGKLDLLTLPWMH
jgi:hypothetical protein